MTHATHAVIESLASSNPELLDAPELEDELTLMMVGYLGHQSEAGKVLDDSAP
jgi:hypothetical protein